MFDILVYEFWTSSRLVLNKSCCSFQETGKSMLKVVDQPPKSWPLKLSFVFKMHFRLFIYYISFKSQPKMLNKWLILWLHPMQDCTRGHFLQLHHVILDWKPSNNNWDFSCFLLGDPYAWLFYVHRHHHWESREFKYSWILNLNWAVWMCSILKTFDKFRLKDNLIFHLLDTVDTKHLQIYQFFICRILHCVCIVCKE